MIKDVVIHNGLLRIATGTFVCKVAHSENASRGIFLEIGPCEVRVPSVFRRNLTSLFRSEKGSTAWLHLAPIRGAIGNCSA